MFVKDALQSMQQGILICNSQGRIIFFNEAYGVFIGCSLEEAKGKSVTDFRKNAMVPEVIKSQIAIEGMIRQEGNQEYFASIYPIIESGEFQGTISVVTTLASHQLKNSLKTHVMLRFKFLQMSTETVYIWEIEIVQFKGVIKKLWRKHQAVLYQTK